MNARKLLEKALRDMGADGLCNDDPCGCGLDDLAPCGEIRDICVPAKADSDVPEEFQDVCDVWYVPMEEEGI